MVGRHPRASGVEYAEAVGVAVGGQSHGGLVLGHGALERREVFFGGIRPGAVEQDIAVGAQRDRWNAALGERAVEIARAAAVQRVVHHGQLRRADFFEVHQLAKPLQIRLARRDLLETVGARKRGCFVRRNGKFRGELRHPRFDILGDFGQRRTAVGGGKFQPVIFRGVVARREIDRAVRLAPKDFMGNRRRRRSGVAQQHTDAMPGKNVGGGAGKLLGIKSPVKPHNHRGLCRAAQYVLRDGRNGQAHVCKGEFIGNARAPSRGPEFNSGLGGKLCGSGRHCAVL